MGAYYNLLVSTKLSGKPSINPGWTEAGPFLQEQTIRRPKLLFPIIVQ